jgi:subtilisin family serine protease
MVAPAWSQSLPKSALEKVIKKEEPVAKDSKSFFDVEGLTSRYASWGIDPENTTSGINLLPAWRQFSKKKDIVVAVIDTGIDSTHPFLYSNIAVKEGSASASNYGIDFSKNREGRTRPSDDHGHGTHVAAIVKSVHPEVKILALKYYNAKASGQDNLNSTIEALRYAVDNNVDIINYSGGGPEPALEELRILKEAERKGILIVAAAGNEESNIDVKQNAYYPASYGLKNIITVTAHDQNLKLLSSSNYGKESVDISAPGFRIRSALPNSRAGYLTGTSQATAFVSGVAALIMGQYPTLSAASIKEIIRSSAQPELTLVSRCASGGRLDANRALELAGQVASKTKSRTIAQARSKKKALKKEAVPGEIIYRLAKKTAN